MIIRRKSEILKENLKHLIQDANKYIRLLNTCIASKYYETKMSSESKRFAKRSSNHKPQVFENIPH